MSMWMQRGVRLDASTRTSVFTHTHTLKTINALPIERQSVNLLFYIKQQLSFYLLENVFLYRGMYSTKASIAS